jgi:CheY-like chemotaxis protein
MTRSVLIVDDDFDFRRRLRSILEPAGFSVFDAGTGEEALQLLEQGIQVALIDLDLPQTNGFDLIRAIRRQFPDVATIAVTGIYMQLYLDIARNVGAHAATRKHEEGKPLEADEWLRLIGSLMGDGATA